MRKIHIALAALMTLAGMVFISANPASASPPQCVTITDHGKTYPVVTVARSWPGANRQGCTVIAVKGTGIPNEFYFQVEANDNIDTEACIGCLNDDAGAIQLQYTTPGSTVWNNFTWDQNSADWIVSWGTTPTYNIILNGRPEQFTWRTRVSAHYYIPNQGWIWGQPYYTLPASIQW